MNHDKHYAQKEIEPIQVIEETIERLTDKLDPKAVFNIGQSLKYLLRAGLKEGESVEKDLDKAFNYLHRAIKGEWACNHQLPKDGEMWFDSESVKEGKPPITQSEFNEIVERYSIGRDIMGTPILKGSKMRIFYNGVHFRDKVIKSISELESIIKKELGVEEKPTFENLMDNYGLNKAENGYYTSVCGLSVCSRSTNYAKALTYMVNYSDHTTRTFYKLEELDKALDEYFN